MIKKYRYGTAFKTQSTVKNLSEEEGDIVFFNVENTHDGFEFRYGMDKDDIVFGLGEQIRGINKRGWIYVSDNSEDQIIHEGRKSLYASHNFILLDGKNTFGAFMDSARKMTFDIGYTDADKLVITCGAVDVYIITGESLSDIVRQFRMLIGTSYIPPKWAFGFGQSRWGYRSEEDIRRVADGYEKNDMPLDMIYLDIDYMDSYKDFTVNGKTFPDFAGFVKEMKDRGIRLVPIIDAAVKVEEGYSVYDEGVKNNYFCKDAEGNDFVVGVWPGDSVFPDFLNPEVRRWFGEKYRVLLDCGVEGFWNDMNEPVMFYSRKQVLKILSSASEINENNFDMPRFSAISDAFRQLASNKNDYASFYHNCGGQKVCHADVHNLYGYYMTRSAAEYFKEYGGGKRYLLFSRSSFIGMHRYGGIWTGDNSSHWGHILLNLKMLPSLNMCGFLYVGADIGGFGDNATEDLLLRWLALGIFTPLMRNHSSAGTRMQECYQFKNKKAFRGILSMRYALIPYLYSEYMKCALRGGMMFSPLCFAYHDDKRARTVEDQLLVGGSIMIAPVYEQNAAGRYVYLPEKMKMIRMSSGKDYTEEILERGDYYIEVPLNEVVFFVRRGHALPLAGPAKNTGLLDETNLKWISFAENDTEYEICRDDGVSAPCADCFERVTVKCGRSKVND